MSKMAVVSNGIVANLIVVGADTDVSILGGELVPVSDEVKLGFVFDEETEQFVEPEPQVQMTEEEAADYVANVPILPPPTVENPEGVL